MKSLEASEAVALAKEESSRRLSAISPKDSRMPRPAPARVRNSLPPWPRILRLMRKSLLPGWTSIKQSTESWRPPTTKCPDINHAEDHHFVLSKLDTFLLNIFVLGIRSLR